MSYILFATSGGGLATPVSIANGGTGGNTSKIAMDNLSSPAFSAPAANVNWGALAVTAPLNPDPVENQAAILELLNVLFQCQIIQVI